MSGEGGFDPIRAYVEGRKSDGAAQAPEAATSSGLEQATGKSSESDLTLENVEPNPILQSEIAPEESVAKVAMALADHLEANLGNYRSGGATEHMISDLIRSFRAEAKKNTDGDIIVNAVAEATDKDDATGSLLWIPDYREGSTTCKYVNTLLKKFITSPGFKIETQILEQADSYAGLQGLASRLVILIKREQPAAVVQAAPPEDFDWKKAEKSSFVSQSEWIAQHPNMKGNFDRLFGCVFPSAAEDGPFVDVKQLPPTWRNYRAFWIQFYAQAKQEPQPLIELNIGRTRRTYPVEVLANSFSIVFSLLEENRYDKVNLFLNNNMLPRFMREILKFYYDKQNAESQEKEEKDAAKSDQSPSQEKQSGKQGVFDRVKMATRRIFS